MIKQLTTKKNIAIEAIKTCPNSEDLELIGTAPLEHYSEQLKFAIQAKEINDDLKFSKVFGYNNNFFYIIEVVKNSKVDGYERGVGYIYKKDKKTYLKRIAPLYCGKNSVECAPSRDPCGRSFCSNDNVLVYSSIPPTYLEALIVEHCVITSSETCLPQLTHLPQDSILARFDDNIEGVTFSDKRLVDKFTDLLSLFTKQIKLAASKLSVKRLETDILDLAPSNDQDIKAKIGSFYYNKSEDVVKVYTKEGWKTVKFQDNL
jgi:hypothetical protein